VEGLLDVLDDEGDHRLEEFMRAAEIALPADAIYADMASERRVQSSPNASELESYLADIATRMTSSLGDDRLARDRILDSLNTIEPFSAYPAVTKVIVDRIRNGIE
jgi:hypothetical protein